MFRPMRRIKQQVSEEECIKILKEEPRGVLSVLGDDGYPYGVPIDHYYDEETGKIFFHGAKEGHKIDALRRCDKASLCVMNKGYQIPGECPGSDGSCFSGKKAPRAGKEIYSHTGGAG